jgi:hypothetical protein
VAFFLFLFLCFCLCSMTVIVFCKRKNIVFHQVWATVDVWTSNQDLVKLGCKSTHIFVVVDRSQLRYSELHLGRNWDILSCNKIATKVFWVAIGSQLQIFWVAIELFQVATGSQLSFFELQLGRNWDFSICNWVVTEIFSITTGS